MVPIFIPHAGCPHQCVFCDQISTTGQSRAFPTLRQLQADIDRFLSYRKDPGRPTEIAFFGGNFLGMTADRIRFLLELGKTYVEQGKVQSLRFSTRPDTITSETLELIAGFPVATIELGVQSMDNTVLQTSRRGHKAEDTLMAVSLLRAGTYRLGLQMMIGLPGDTAEQALSTAAHIVALAPDFVRIYPTLVLKGSPLARWYAQGRFTPMTLAEAVELAKGLVSIFLTAGIKVIRIGLQPTDDLNSGAAVLAGPFHPAFGELVYGALWRDALNRWLRKQSIFGQPIEIAVHPNSVSRVRGHKNENFKWITRGFHPGRITLRMARDLPTDRILLNGEVCDLVL